MLLKQSEWHRYALRLSTRETQGQPNFHWREYAHNKCVRWSGDAKFCVSTGWRHWYGMMDMFVSYLCMQKVETQNLASHKQRGAMNWDGYVPAVVAFFARETQNFASLLGWRQHWVDKKNAKWQNINDIFPLFYHIYPVIRRIIYRTPPKRLPPPASPMGMTAALTP